MSIVARAREPAEALLSVRELLDATGERKVLHSFYFEYMRRLFTLRLISGACTPGSTIVDVGASPFVLSCALKLMGYNVIAVDFNPEEYGALARKCGVELVEADLERDGLCLPDESADCAVFTEVLEHLNPYYVSHTLCEINRILKPGGKLVLTTPNIASLFRRLRLLLGIQPQYTLHVHEYTKKEVEELLVKHGFMILESQYSDVNDLTYLDAEPEAYLSLKSYWDLLKLLMRKPTRLNVLRVLAYPFVKLIPSLRMLIVVAAEKRERATPLAVERW